MWRRLGYLSLLLSFVLTAQGQVQAQGKDKKGGNNKTTAEPATPQEYKQLQHVKELDGTLVNGGGASAMLTLRIDIPHFEPNPNFKPGKASGANNQYQQMQNIYRQQAAVMQIANPIQRQQRMQQLMATLQRQQYQQLQQASRANNPNHNNGPFKLVHLYKDFDLDTADKLVVRKMSLGTEYDDKGNIKEYTPAELAKLRGKEGKPGFKADVADLQSGQQVHVYLTMPKKDAKPAEKPADKNDKVDKKDADKKDVAKNDHDKADKADKAAPKNTPKEGDEPMAEVARPVVTMIVIVQEATNPASSAERPKKKEK